ncbi:MAG: phytanoyl-CoA dioxygenase family protein [Pseudomonadales bacterium]|nr:phytanoyl-CoA dioxygenase family protein [Pseudomonadales bacterium]
MLDLDQIEAYRQDGYLLVRKLIAEDELERWTSRFVDVVNGNLRQARGMVLMKDVMVAKGAVVPTDALFGVNKLLNFEDDPEFYSYVEHPNLIAVVNDLIGNDLYSLVTNVFNKPPEVDGRHPLHQDLRYFRMRPPEKIVAAWTAISKCTRDNGCLAVVPKSHLLGALDHRLPDWEFVNYAFYGIKETAGLERVHIEMEPGDTVFFHPLLVHGSGRNLTNECRRSISTHYASHACESPAPDWRENDRVRRVQGS